MEHKTKIQAVYRLKNLENGKCYIGSSNDLTSRFSTHYSLLKLNNHNCYELQKDFNLGHRFKDEILWQPKIQIDSSILRRVEAWFILRDSTHIEGYNTFISCFSSEGSARRRAIDPFLAEKIARKNRQAIPYDTDSRKQFESVCKIVDTALECIKWDVEDLYFYYSERYEQWNKNGIQQ